MADEAQGYSRPGSGLMTWTRCDSWHLTRGAVRQAMLMVCFWWWGMSLTEILLLGLLVAFAVAIGDTLIDSYYRAGPNGESR